MERDESRWGQWQGKANAKQKNSLVICLIIYCHNRAVYYYYYCRDDGLR